MHRTYPSSQRSNGYENPPEETFAGSGVLKYGDTVTTNPHPSGKAIHQLGPTHRDLGNRWGYYDQPMEMDAESFARRIVDLLMARW